LALRSKKTSKDEKASTVLKFILGMFRILMLNWPYFNFGIGNRTSICIYIHASRTSRLWLTWPFLHEPGMIFNPGQHATGGYFLFGLHEPGLTKIFADPGQQSSTRAGSVIFRATDWSRVYFWDLYPLYDCRL
jgi:hypothetical protein